MNEKTNKLSNRDHGIIIDERSKVSMTGVSDVLCFDNNTVVLNTVMGELTIKGEGLKVSNFTAETGDLLIEGKFFAMAYTGEASKKSRLSRLFG